MKCGHVLCAACTVGGDETACPFHCDSKRDNGNEPVSPQAMSRALDHNQVEGQGQVCLDAVSGLAGITMEQADSLEAPNQHSASEQDLGHTRDAAPVGQGPSGQVGSTAGGTENLDNDLQVHACLS